MRIVSLIASSTEILCALGLREFMVGRSHECDFPESIKELPICTSPKFNVDGKSYMIDERVRRILQESLSVYRVDADLLSKLAPTHIVTQSQCEVCAVSLKDVENAVCEMIDSEPQIISLEPNQLSDIWSDIAKVGTACGVSSKAAELVNELKAQMAEIENKANSLSSEPRVGLIEWIDPLMASGNWMPELVRMGGGIDIFGEAGKHSAVMDWAKLAEADPDVLIIAPCGFGIQQIMEEMADMQERPGWQNLTAVKNNKVYVADGNQYFNRPGPRVKESLQIVAEILHPEAFSFGLEGKGWIRFEG